MKTIILAAGKGERLKGVIDDIPKPMIKVGGKPILEHIIIWLSNEGFKDIHINLHCFSDTIVSHFGRGYRNGVNIYYYKEEKLLGTSGSVRNIAGNWKEPFLVVYGDNIYPPDYSLKDLVAFHSEKGNIATIGLYNSENIVCGGGVAFLDECERIIGFIEKPSIINTGIYVFDNNIIDYIPEGFSDFGMDIFPRLVDERAVNSFIFEGQIVAVDTPELLRKATK